MTSSLAISIAESARWTVVGTMERPNSVTLFLRTPLGRDFQLTVYPDWDEARVREKLDMIRSAPF